MRRDISMFFHCQQHHSEKYREQFSLTIFNSKLFCNGDGWQFIFLLWFIIESFSVSINLGLTLSAEVITKSYIYKTWQRVGWADTKPNPLIDLIHNKASLILAFFYEWLNGLIHNEMKTERVNIFQFLSKNKQCHTNYWVVKTIFSFELYNSSTRIIDWAPRYWKNSAWCWIFIKSLFCAGDTRPCFTER